MRYESASKYIRQRLQVSGTCAICGKPVGRYEEFDYIAVPIGKCKYYNFFHRDCLQSARRMRIADVELTSRG